jgi:pyruvate dehydrogenase E2 component (dihydrolipoamide acetyltransferase)
MPTNILMPALSPTMEKGNLSKWLKKEGDPVKSGDVIAEIETDKATMEVEAVDEGTLAKIVVPEGAQDVPVNSVIAVLAGEGEDAKAVKAPAAPGPKAEIKPQASSPSPQPSPQRGEGAGRAPVSAPSTPSTSPQRGEAAAPSGRASGAPNDKPRTAGEGARTNGKGSRIFASPLARRAAKEAGIDLAVLRGSGPHGRIIARDIEQARKGGVAPRPAAPGAAPQGVAIRAPSDTQIRAYYEDGSYDFVPHDGMRKTIGRRLLEAKLTIPHYYLTVDCELDALLKAREEINEGAPQIEGKPRWKLSVNDFVIKALALALIKVPNANVTWTEAGMLKHKHADVGVAVALDGGLITPIIRHAEQKTLAVISAEMKELAARARARRLKPNEYEGGSSSVSNLGMYGVREFAAVINPPQSSILAVGAGEQRAVAKNGELSVATIMTVTLSADHRAVDGAVGAELLAAFKGYLEKPIGMLV